MQSMGGVSEISLLIKTAEGRILSSACTGNCSIAQSSNFTPTVTAVSPEKVTGANTTLTISGKHTWYWRVYVYVLQRPRCT